MAEGDDVRRYNYSAEIHAEQQRPALRSQIHPLCFLTASVWVQRLIS